MSPLPTLAEELVTRLARLKLFRLNGFWAREQAEWQELHRLSEELRAAVEKREQA